MCVRRLMLLIVYATYTSKRIFPVSNYVILITHIHKNIVNTRNDTRAALYVTLLC